MNLQDIFTDHDIRPHPDRPVQPPGPGEPDSDDVPGPVIIPEEVPPLEKPIEPIRIPGAPVPGMPKPIIRPL